MTTNATSSSPQTAGRGDRFGTALNQLASWVWDFFVNAVAQVRIWDKSYAGFMHILIFTGVTIQVLGTFVNLTQMQLFIPLLELPFPRGNGYLFFELIMDLAGAAILIGVLLAFFRRFVMRPKALETGWDDYYALGLLALIPIAGFSLEGARILSAAPAWSQWSPIGNQVANLFRAVGLTPESAVILHRYLIFSHVFLALTLVASIPFTKLRHLIYTPLNIILRSRRKKSTLEKIEDIEEAETLGVGKISEFTTKQLLSFDACVRCGRCEEVCPVAVSGISYSPREFIQFMRQAMITSLVLPGENGHQEEDLLGVMVPEETPWYCTTCGACLDRCPAFVNPIDEIIDLRRYQVLTTGKMPKSVGDVLRNMERQGNPWGMPAEERVAWAKDFQVRELAPGDETDVLLFMGCASAYDERNKKVARASVRLLQSAGVDFGILGIEEMCCGETSRRLGHEYLFQMMVDQNMEVFSRIKFNRIVTACPHCFNTLKNEYPQFGPSLEVQHLTEYLANLPQIKSLFSSNGISVEGRLVIHDSCYLGRYNQIYQQPRQLLSMIRADPGEMARKGENSFCCGGGGGQMWMETDPNTRINHRRLNDAIDAGADIVATACPYCLLMFDDAIRSKGYGDQIQVQDIVEIMANQLG